MTSLQNFFKAAGMVLSDPKLRRWYLNALLRTVAVAIVVFAILLSLGFYGLWRGVGHWWGSVASILYVIVLFYISGTVTSLIANALVQMVAGEKTLLRALPAATAPPVTNRTPSIFVHRRREYLGIVLSLVVSVTVFPLLLFPLVMPVGLILVAWALGQENHKAVDRLLFQNNEASSLTVKRDIGFSRHVGLGLVPAVASIFPLAGWICLPILQVAAVLDLRELTR